MNTLKFSPDQIRRIKELREKAITMKEISKIYKCSVKKLRTL